MATHHIPADLLLEYVTGSLGQAQSLLVATHLSRCAICDAEQAMLEEVGGLWVEEAVPEPPIGLAAMLARLAEPAPPPPAPPPPLAPELADLELPEPLRSVIASSRATFETVVPGLLHQLTLPIALEGIPVRLARLRGGSRVPRHTHQGRELNLVLAGGFHDDDIGFAPGDISDNDSERTHELRIDPGEDCLLLVVNSGPLVPVGLTARLASWITGF